MFQTAGRRRNCRQRSTWQLPHPSDFPGRPIQLLVQIWLVTPLLTSTRDLGSVTFLIWAHCSSKKESIRKGEEKLDRGRKLFWFRAMGGGSIHLNNILFRAATWTTLAMREGGWEIQLYSWAHSSLNKNQDPLHKEKEWTLGKLLALLATITLNPL